ncbi:SH3-domain-containing protein [Sistotremastrum suecicum HHB10207 ss-3]|uniref:SH3-domain-containing protein n=1 Tax=Sistotremastrum suecicum HHB10207 ss-3 TaxID=1314776 RepID=A0A166G3N8_9AGAM|nr:SH3-domain-containing protein [Sistotremastrum suecicum HHB10207 ss-3]
MAHNPSVEYLASRMKSDVEFLISQGYMSQADGDVVISKLPGSNRAPQPTAPAPRAFNPPMPTAPNGRLPGLGRHAPPPPPPVPRAPALPQAKALWSYNEDGSDTEDLSFQAGQIIDILEEVNADWYRGRVNGREGLVPSSYVEKLTTPVTSPAPPSYTHLPDPKPVASGMVAPQPAVGGRFMAPPPPGGGFRPPPILPQQQPEAPPSQGEPKKSKFGKFGAQAGSAAVSGVGFGAGAAVGSGIINAIF